ALDPFHNADPWQVIFYIVTVPNGTPAGNCLSSGTAFTIVQIFTLQPGTTATVSPASPLALLPPAAQTRCMIVYGRNRAGTSSNDTGLIFVSATGYVGSG